MTDKGSYRTHNVTGCTEPAEVERASSDQNCYRIGEIDKLSSEETGICTHGSYCNGTCNLKKGLKMNKGTSAKC